MRAQSSAPLAAAAAQVEAQPALTRARAEPSLLAPPHAALVPKPRPDTDLKAPPRKGEAATPCNPGCSPMHCRLQPHAVQAAAPCTAGCRPTHALQVEAQQGGMAEQHERLHALLARQAVEKEALEERALASAEERAGLASQLSELQVGCNPTCRQGCIPCVLEAAAQCGGGRGWWAR